MHDPAAVVAIRQADEPVALVRLWERDVAELGGHRLFASAWPARSPPDPLLIRRQRAWAWPGGMAVFVVLCGCCALSFRRDARTLAAGGPTAPTDLPHGGARSAPVAAAPRAAGDAGSGPSPGQ